MLATITGLSSPATGFASTIPQMAPEARVKIWREIRLIPETSTMLGNITMSLTPTYWAVLPLASVETINFGNPTAKARIADVAIAVPPRRPTK